MKLKNDKEIILTTAGNRKSTNWNPQKMKWSDFLTKISHPSKSTKTLKEYKAMSKSDQDNLKDVGGYVGGTLTGKRRKSGSVSGRYLVTLDADSIEAGGTQRVLDAVDGLDCAYAVHSTMKHENAAPRLRIIFPLDEPCSADEYEPIARKLASHIGMGVFDSTTFETERFMYWPGCLLDIDYVFEYGDKPFLSRQEMLDQYEDWRNIAEWAEVPGAAKIHSPSLKKQSDPLGKKGVVGAFCRCYGIEEAMAKFIPDVYIPCDGDRYTYAGGSTVGGAVIYDDGKFLYSHHATDPCGGNLNNSFDMVRLHLFGEEDADAKADTPSTKLPSFIKMCEFAAQDSAVIQECARAEFFDNADGTTEQQLFPDFKMNGKTIVLLPTCDNLKVLLANSGIGVRYDIIKRDTEITGSNKELVKKFNTPPNGYNNLLVHCMDEFTKLGVRVSTAKMHEWMMKIADDNRVNVVTDLLETNYMLYGGTKAIRSYYDCLEVIGDYDFGYTLLCKWLCQCVAMAHNEHGLYGADGVLTAKGIHGIGKSTFFRRANIAAAKYFIEGVQIDGGKDKLMESTSNWIGEIGELPRSMKDYEYIKVFVTSPVDKFRAPYGKKAEIYPRFTSFCATTNSDFFLKEDTERRFWVIHAKSVDLKALDQVCFESVWAEAYEMYLALGQKSFRLTKEEREKLRIYNAQYRIASDEEKLLLDKLDWNQPREQWKEFTATAICELLDRNNISPVKLGKALKLIGYAKDSKDYPMRIKNGYSLYLTPNKTTHYYDLMSGDEGLTNEDDILGQLT